ncbi:MAG TPA: ATP synthase F1 subunit delta [Candidatus Angelobacter sp.]|nr:ATP synthase F1 subunit delta [Candidatus Angelobacter sp.]
MAAVSGRYARAYAEVVSAEGSDLDKSIEELNQIAVLIHDSSELRHIFQNPSVEHKQKLGLLDAIMERSGGLESKNRKLLRNFIAVLIDQKRIGLVEEIAALFKQELERRMGIEEANVSSARELTPAERKSLEQRLTAVTGKKVRAKYSLDSALLGGAVVRMGSTIYDGSVKGQLQRLKEQIAGRS